MKGVTPRGRRQFGDFSEGLRFLGNHSSSIREFAGDPPRSSQPMDIQIVQRQIFPLKPGFPKLVNISLFSIPYRVRTLSGWHARHGGM